MIHKFSCPWMSPKNVSRRRFFRVVVDVEVRFCVLLSSFPVTQRDEGRTRFDVTFVQIRR